MTLELPFSQSERERKTYYSPDPTMLPRVDWRPPRLASLPSWRDAKRVCLDVETRDETLNDLGPGCRRDPSTHYVCGVAFAIEDGPAHYLPIRHEGGDNVEGGPDGVWAYIRNQLREFRGTLIFNEAQYDLDWICQESGSEEILQKPIIDVQCADVMISELEMKYGLDALCERHGLPGKDETLLREAAAIYRVHPKTGLWRMRGRDVAAYGIGDVVRPLQVYRRQEPKIEAEGTESIWKLEQQITPICVMIRRVGVRIDLDKLEHVESRAREVIREEMARVAHMTGVKLGPADIWKSDALARALQVAGYDVPRTARDKDSVDKGFLAKCGPVGAAMLRARRWGKLETTFAKQVREQLTRGRVHVTFHQLRNNSDARDGDAKGVRYGRFSSTDFNFQYQPIRNEEFGELWRSVFVKDEGAEGWACCDWSQQEPRIGVHYAERLGLPGAKEFADEYRANPALDIHQKLADISGLKRSIVKNQVNGRLYGEGDLKLCVDLGQPVRNKKTGEERYITNGELAAMSKEQRWNYEPGRVGRGMISQLNEYAPWLTGLVREASRAAEKNGHVWTILRRKCRFQRGPDGRVWKAHKGFNRVGQGSAGDQFKATLVAMVKAGLLPQIIVHDEFDRSYKSLDELREMKRLMLETVRFSVPMKVDVEVGPSWGELKKLEDL